MARCSEAIVTSLPDPVPHRRRSVRIGIRLRHSAPRSLMNAGVLGRCRRGARLATTHGSATWPDALRPVHRYNEGARELPIGWRSSAIAVALRHARYSSRIRSDRCSVSQAIARRAALAFRVDWHRYEGTLTAPCERQVRTHASAAITGISAPLCSTPKTSTSLPPIMASWWTSDRLKPIATWASLSAGRLGIVNS